MSLLFVAKVKRDGLWGPGRFASGYTGLIKLIQSLRGESYPAAIMKMHGEPGYSQEVVYLNEEARKLGMYTGQFI